VKTHVNRILTKLQLQSRVQAVVLGYESGLVVPGDQIPVGGVGGVGAFEPLSSRARQL
jgi:hypothetical protein